MEAGKLDRRVILLRASVTRAPRSNAPVETWVELARRWASKRTVSDGEAAKSAEIAATITDRFQIRWEARFADLNPKDRLMCEGREYNIVAVREVGRREGWEISAKARADT
jgi:SPP1 family predicted phage head-tail adaptor